MDKSVSGVATVTCKNVSDMAWMFFRCCNITSIDLSNFDTSEVVNTTSMLFSCEKLTSIDLSSFDTSNVIGMAAMFYDCSNLTTIKGIIDMKSCEYYQSMFKNCPKLSGVKIKNPPADFESSTELSSSQYTVVS